MSKPHQLVSKSEHVAKNAKRYWDDLKDRAHGEFLQRLIPRVHHWYVHEDDKGLWFVPSKFGGYREMTAAIYREKYNDEKDNGGLHGKATENQLKQMSIEIDPVEPRYARFSDELDEQLWQFGQRRRKGSTISVLK